MRYARNLSRVQRKLQLFDYTLHLPTQITLHDLLSVSIHVNHEIYDIGPKANTIKNNQKYQNNVWKYPIILKYRRKTSKSFQNCAPEMLLICSSFMPKILAGAPKTKKEQFVLRGPTFFEGFSKARAKNRVLNILNGLAGYLRYLSTFYLRVGGQGPHRLMLYNT